MGISVSEVTWQNKVLEAIVAHGHRKKKCWALQQEKVYLGKHCKFPTAAFPNEWHCTSLCNLSVLDRPAVILAGTGLIARATRHLSLLGSPGGSTVVWLSTRTQTGFLGLISGSGPASTTVHITSPPSISVSCLKTL